MNSRGAGHRFQAAHTLAVLVIIGCFVLMALGKDGIVHTVLLTVTIFFFGKKADAEPKGEERKIFGPRRDPET